MKTYILILHLCVILRSSSTTKYRSSSGVEVKRDTEARLPFRFYFLMSSHCSKNLNKLLKSIESIGFRIEVKAHRVKITPPKSIKAEVYITHYGEKGYHPVRRYIKNVCNIDV